MNQAELFATLWTLFRIVCPRCGGDDFKPIARSNGRVQRCCRCHRHVSVTASSVMSHTQLPIEAWLWTLEHVHQLPSIGAIARRFDIAKSSAWYLVLRIATAIRERRRRSEEAEASPTARHVVVTLPLRPAIGPPMPPSAPTPTQLGGVGIVDVALRMTASGRAFLVGITPSRASTVSAPTEPIARWLWDQLVVARQTVSLRWTPHWVDLMLHAWEARSLSPLLLLVPHIPLWRLDPWLRARPTARSP
jgi:transposase-like protein